LRKSELTQLQAQIPPFGGLAGAYPARVFMSPGPIFEPQSPVPDAWGFARALYAAGFRKGEILHNCFAYHMTPGGFLLDDGGRSLGLSVFPAGPGNTEMQVEAIAHLKPAGYAGTPDYLKVILDKAAELGRDASSIKKALVTGGALFPSLREEYRVRSIAVLQAYGTADLGCIAYESAAMEGMIVNEDMIVEIVRTGTGEPALEGEVGEVVVTTFNETYPLIRFATGDLSAFMPGQSPCGRTNKRIKGWMGRADQTVKVKGMFVHPSQIAEVGRRHPELGRLRLTVTREGEQDIMTLYAESVAADEGLRAKAAETLIAVTKLKGAVQFVASGSLPNDGKVIADERKYGE
jgi:phenylacetate-CoA ligase